MRSWRAGIVIGLALCTLSVLCAVGVSEARAQSSMDATLAKIEVFGRGDAAVETIMPADADDLEHTITVPFAIDGVFVQATPSDSKVRLVEMTVPAQDDPPLFGLRLDDIVAQPSRFIGLSPGAERVLTITVTPEDRDATALIYTVSITRGNTDQMEAVMLERDSYVGTEGELPLAIVVRLSAPAPMGGTSVEYTLTDAGAHPSQVRYADLPSSPLQFAEGEVSQTITFTLEDNEFLENDRNNLTFALAVPTGYQAGPITSARIDLLDDDTPDGGELTLGGADASGSYSVSEGDGVLRVPVTIDKFASEDLIFTAVLAGNAREDSDRGESDYEIANKEIRFAARADEPKDKTQDLEFTIIDDLLGEADESIIFTLTRGGRTGLIENYDLPAPATITIKASSEDPPGEGEARLNSLEFSVGTLSPRFAANVEEYTLAVPNDVASVTATTVARAIAAKVEVNGMEVESVHTSPLQGGGPMPSDPIMLMRDITQTITIRVTAENGAMKTYTIDATRAQSGDAMLSGLSVTNGMLEPRFVPTFAGPYAVSVANAVAMVQITPSANNDKASITVDGVRVVSGEASADIALTPAIPKTISVVVTAETGATQTYTIIVTRLPAPSLATDASLDSLQILDDLDNVIHTIALADNPPHAYSVAIPHEFDVVALLASPSDEDVASMELTVPAQTSPALDGFVDDEVIDEISFEIELTPEVARTIFYEVTAADGETRLRYELTMTRAAAAAVMPLPSVSLDIGSYTGSEGEGGVTVMVTLSEAVATGEMVEVPFVVFDSEIGAGEVEYEVSSSSVSPLVFTADKNSHTITLTPTPNEMSQRDNRGIVLRLDVPPEYQAGALTRAFFTFTDDDTCRPCRIVFGEISNFDAVTFNPIDSFRPESAVEGDTVTLPISIEQLASEPLMFQIFYGGAKEIEPTDYTASDNIITFKEGEELTQYVDVKILEDNMDEETEQLILTLLPVAADLATCGTPDSVPECDFVLPSDAASAVITITSSEDEVFLHSIAVAGGARIGGDANFDPEVLAHSFLLAEHANDANVTITLSPPTATATLDGVGVTLGKPFPITNLRDGINEFDLRVSAAVGNHMKDYTITIINPTAGGTDGVRLTSLQLAPTPAPPSPPYMFPPAFAPDTFDYTLLVPHSVTQITATLAPNLRLGTPEMRTIALAVGVNEESFIVGPIEEDGGVTVYTLRVHRAAAGASNDALLTAVRTSLGEATLIAGELAYALGVARDARVITITPSASGTVLIGGVIVPAGEASAPQTIAATIPIRVIAENNASEQIYELQITRINPNAEPTVANVRTTLARASITALASALDILEQHVFTAPAAQKVPDSIGATSSAPAAQNLTAPLLLSEAPLRRDANWRDIVDTSGFRLSLNGDESANEFDGWSVWGAGDVRGFTDAAIEGLTIGGYVGADYRTADWLIGVAVNYSASESELASGERAATWLVSGYPYVRFSPNERLDVWAMAGAGSGALRLQQADFSTNIFQYFYALGGKAELAQVNNIEIAFRTDLASAIASSSSNARLEAVGTEDYRWRGSLVARAELGAADPYLDIGARLDVGDEEVLVGAELGGGVQYRVGRASLNARGRVLLYDTGGIALREWGAGATVRYLPAADGTGLFLSLTPSLGALEGDSNALWQDARGAPAAAAHQAAPPAAAGNPTAALQAELGFGMRHKQAVLSPFARYLLAANRQTFGLGTRLQLAPLSLEMLGERVESDTYRLSLTFRLGF